jgi:hypothetical protein
MRRTAVAPIARPTRSLLRIASSINGLMGSPGCSIRMTKKLADIMNVPSAQASIR